MMRRAFASAVALSFASGCAWRRGALDPVSGDASRIQALFGWFFWISVVVLAGVLVVLAVGVVKSRARRAREGDGVELEPSASLEWRTRRAVLASTVVSVAILIGLAGASMVSDRDLFRTRRPVFHMRLIAHQWWWEVHYLGPRPDQTVTTANELHLPAGSVVEVELHSSDVIHSLWIPNLHGKRDLIPGHTNRIVLAPDRVGRYDGRCAEFCGLEHARMDLAVFVETEERFSRFIEAQRRPGKAPAEPSARRGAELFQRGPCALCHAITGTDAAASAGPDLTHVASRAWLGAGTLENSKSNLRRWLTETQTLKPGVQMPPTVMPDAELADLVSYLGTLE